MAGFLGAFAKRRKQTTHDAGDAQSPGCRLLTLPKHTRACRSNPRASMLNGQSDYLLKATTKAWDDAVQLGEKYGYLCADDRDRPTGTHRPGDGLRYHRRRTRFRPGGSKTQRRRLFKIINKAYRLPCNLKYSEREIQRSWVMQRTRFARQSAFHQYQDPLEKDSPRKTSIN